MTQRQSNNQWSGGIAAHHVPKIPSAKIRWKSSRLYFLGSRQHPTHWLSSKGLNYQRGVLLISAGVIEGHFEVKMPRGGKITKGVLFLHYNAPAHRTLATRRNWLTLASIVLITYPILRIWHRLTTTCSLDLKNNWKFTLFRPTRRSFFHNFLRSSQITLFFNIPSSGSQVFHVVWKMDQKPSWN